MTLNEFFLVEYLVGRFGPTEEMVTASGLLYMHWDSITLSKCRKLTLYLAPKHYDLYVYDPHLNGGSWRKRTIDQIITL